MGPSREELLGQISPDMRLTMSFFKRIYGYEFSTPGFANRAIATLEAAGCSRAREYYNAFANSYEQQHEAMMREVAAWYVDMMHKRRERARKKAANEQRAKKEKTKRLQVKRQED